MPEVSRRIEFPISDGFLTLIFLIGKFVVTNDTGLSGTQRKKQRQSGEETTNDNANMMFQVVRNLKS